MTTNIPNMKTNLQSLTRRFKKSAREKDRAAFTNVFKDAIEQEVLHKELWYVMPFIKDKDVIEWMFELFESEGVNIAKVFGWKRTLLHRLRDVRKDVAIAFIDEWHKRGFSVDPQIGADNTPLGCYLEAHNYHKIHAEVVSKFLSCGADVNALHKIIRDLEPILADTPTSPTPVWTHLFRTMEGRNEDVMRLIIANENFPTTLDEVRVNVAPKDIAPGEFESIESNVGAVLVNHIKNKLMDDGVSSDTRVQDVLWLLFDRCGVDSQNKILSGASEVLLKKAYLSKAGAKTIEAYLKNNKWSAPVDVEKLLLDMLLFGYTASNDSRHHQHIFNLALKFVENNKKNGLVEDFLKVNEIKIMIQLFVCFPGAKKLAIDALGNIDVKVVLESVIDSGFISHSYVSDWRRDSKFWVGKLKTQMDKNGLSEFNLDCLENAKMVDVYSAEPILKEMCRVGLCSAVRVRKIIDRALKEYNNNAPSYSSKSERDAYSKIVPEWDRLSLLEGRPMSAKRVERVL